MDRDAAWLLVLLLGTIALMTRLFSCQVESAAEQIQQQQPYKLHAGMRYAGFLDDSDAGTYLVDDRLTSSGDPHGRPD